MDVAARHRVADAEELIGALGIAHKVLGPAVQKSLLVHLAQVARDRLERERLRFEQTWAEVPRVSVEANTSRAKRMRVSIARCPATASSCT